MTHRQINLVTQLSFMLSCCVFESKNQRIARGHARLRMYVVNESMISDI